MLRICNEKVCKQREVCRFMERRARESNVTTTVVEEAGCFSCVVVIVWVLIGNKRHRGSLMGT